MPDNNGRWQQLASMGMEFAAAVVGLTLFGWWLDRSLGTSPRWTIICAVVGVVGGFYNLIRRALGAAKVGGPPGRKTRKGPDADESDSRSR